MQTLHLLEEKRRKKEAERLRQPATPLFPSSRSHGTFSLLALEGLRLCCAQWHQMTNDSDKYLPDPPEPRLANPRVDAEKAPMMLCAPAYKVLEEKGFLCKPFQGAVGSALANSKTTLQKSQHWARTYISRTGVPRCRYNCNCKQKARCRFTRSSACLPS